jgi:hypothetical protein
MAKKSTKTKNDYSIHPGQGWHYDSPEHALAAKGVSTKGNSKSEPKTELIVPSTSFSQEYEFYGPSTITTAPADEDDIFNWGDKKGKDKKESKEDIEEDEKEDYSLVDEEIYVDEQIRAQRFEKYETTENKVKLIMYRNDRFGVVADSRRNLRKYGFDDYDLPDDEWIVVTIDFIKDKSYARGFDTEGEAGRHGREIIKRYGGM